MVDKTIIYHIIVTILLCVMNIVLINIVIESSLHSIPKLIVTFVITALIIFTMILWNRIIKRKLK